MKRNKEEYQEELVNQYLWVLIKQFNLSHENSESLKKKLDWVFKQEGVILFTKRSQMLGDSIMKTFDKALHKKAVQVLKKYADELSLLKYMEAEGYKFEENKEGYIDSINARRFLIFPKGLKEEIKESLKKENLTYELYQFAECDGTDLMIGWI